MKKGITLIALVITIVTLVILAAVSITFLNGENGIINKATSSKSKANIEDIKETAEVIRTGFISKNNGDDPTSRFIIEQLIEQQKITVGQVQNYGDADGIGTIIVEGEEIQIIGKLGRVEITEAENIFTYTPDGYITGLKNEHVDYYTGYGAPIVCTIDDEGNRTFSYDNGTSLGPYYGYAVSDISNIVIPSKIGNTEIIGLSNKAFYNYRNVEKVTMGDNIFEIGEAFSGCKDMESIRLSNNIISIDQNAFSYCQKLKSIAIPENVESIGQCAFAYCNELKRLIIGSRVSSISVNCLYYSYGVETIEINEHNPIFDSRDNCNCVVDSVNDKVIIGCKGSTVPESIKGIGERAFNGANMSSITLPSTLEYIESEAFRYSLITSIDLGGVQTIGERAFGDTRLEEVVIPDSTTTISRVAFSQNKFLRSVTLGEGVTTIGESAFSFCDNLETFNFGSNVRNIGNNIFCWDYSLDNVILPEGLETITYDMFNRCTSLKTIYIPDSVKTIDKHAFSGCSALKHIYFPSSVTRVLGNNSSSQVTFWDCSSDLIVYTGHASKPSGWNYYYNWVAHNTYITTKFNYTRAQYEAEVGINQ